MFYIKIPCLYKLCLNIYKASILSHVHRVCDVYVNLVLKKEKYILGRIGLNFWGFEEQLNYFGDLGSISKILLGS